MTSNFVLPQSPVIQGSYLDVPVKREADEIVITVQSTRTNLLYNYAALNELEIYVEARNTDDR